MRPWQRTLAALASFVLLTTHDVLVTSRAYALDVSCGVAGADSGGWAVATGGDFDGDGVADIALGGPCGAVSGMRRAGRVLVFSGRDGRRILALRGAQVDQRFGASVDFLSDIDGDGADELIVGSFGWTVMLPGGGSISAAGKVEVINRNRTVLLVVEGSTSQANFGESVAAVGDVDLDGYEDFLVGAGDDRNNGDRVGRAYLLSGADGAVLDTSTGAARFDSWGSTVSRAIDVNDDGVSDVIVASNLADDTATGSENNGIVHVLSATDLSTILVRVVGGPEDKLGQSVAPAGVRGFYAGAPAADPNGRSKAGVATLYDWEGNALVTFWEPSPEVNAAFGSSLALIGDVDADGVADVAVGAPGATVAGRSDAGRVSVFSGMDHTLLWSASGDRKSLRLGHSLAAGSDFDGDGIADLLVGAPGDAPKGRRGAGSVRVLSGVDGSEIFRLEGRRGLETRIFTLGWRFGGWAYLKSYNHAGRRKEVRRRVLRRATAGSMSVALLDESSDPVANKMLVVVSAGPDAGSDTVELYRAGRRSVRLFSTRGIGGAYAGGVSVAAGNVIGSETEEIVIAQGKSNDGNVAVNILEKFDVDPFGNINWKPPQTIQAFASDDVIDFVTVAAGGAHVAVGDVVTDLANLEEIVVGPVGGAPVVRVLKGDGEVLAQWVAYAPADSEGVFVATADLDGDGLAEILTAPHRGQPWVKAWRGDGSPYPSASAQVSFFAAMPDVTEGLRIAAADVDLDGVKEILVAIGPGGDGTIRAFETSGAEVTGWRDLRPNGPGSNVVAFAATDRFLRH